MPHDTFPSRYLKIPKSAESYLKDIQYKCVLDEEVNKVLKENSKRPKEEIRASFFKKYNKTDPRLKNSLVEE